MNTLFALWRRSPSGERQVLCLQNVANESINACVDLTGSQGQDSVFVDLLSGQEFTALDNRLLIESAPYGVLWLRVKEQ